MPSPRPPNYPIIITTQLIIFFTGFLLIFPQFSQHTQFMHSFNHHYTFNICDQPSKISPSKISPSSSSSSSSSQSLSVQQYYCPSSQSYNYQILTIISTSMLAIILTTSLKLKIFSVFSYAYYTLLTNNPIDTFGHFYNLIYFIMQIFVIWMGIQSVIDNDEWIKQIYRRKFNMEQQLGYYDQGWYPFQIPVQYQDNNQMESRKYQIKRVKQIGKFKDQKEIQQLLDWVQHKQKNTSKDEAKIWNLKGKKLEQYLKSTLNTLKQKQKQSANTSTNTSITTASTTNNNDSKNTSTVTNKNTNTIVKNRNSKQNNIKQNKNKKQ